MKEDLKDLARVALNLVDDVRYSKVGMAVEDAVVIAAAIPVGFALGVKEGLKKAKKYKGIENEYVSNYEDDYRNIGLLTDAETL